MLETACYGVQERNDLIWGKPDNELKFQHIIQSFCNNLVVTMQYSNAILILAYLVGDLLVAYSGVNPIPFPK